MSPRGIGSYSHFQNIRIPRSQREAGSDHIPLVHSGTMRTTWLYAASLIIAVLVMAMALVTNGWMGM